MAALKFNVDVAKLRTGQSGRRTVSAARRALELETTDLVAALGRFVTAIPQNVMEAVATVAFGLEAAIKRRTPVDTGRARASIHTVVGGASGSYTYSWSGNTRTGKPGGNADGTLDETPASPLTGVAEAIVGSNVVYLPALEAGHSKQAPSGMFRVSIAERRGELEAATELALQVAAKASGV